MTVWSPGLDLIYIYSAIRLSLRLVTNFRFAVTLRNAILEHWRVESPHWVFMVCPGPPIQDEVTI